MTDPVAIDDIISAGANAPLVISIANILLANDSDPDGDPVSLQSFDQPANGILVDNGDGTLTYTPNAGFLGVDIFTYTISDGNGGTDTATVSLDVALPGDIFSDDFSGAVLDTDWTLQGPAGTADVAQAGSEAYLEIAVPSGGSYDAWNTNTSSRVMQTATNEDFGLEAKFLSTPSEKYQMQGILVEQDASNWLRFDTYSNGSKQFVFAAVTLGGSSAVQFNIEVAAGSAPYLRLDRAGDLWTAQYSIDGQTWTTAGNFTQALAVSSAGVFAGSTGGAPGFTAQVDYFFNSAAPISSEDGAIGQTPVAGDDTAAADLDTPLVINVASDLLANDSDPNGDPLSLAGFTQPANGTLVDNGDGTLTYTPNTGYLGADSFGYTVTDGTNTDTATVDVTVTNPADPPVAVDDAASADLDTPLVINVASDLLANDTDPNGDPLSLAGFTQPANGTVVDNGDGTLTYTPNTGYLGADSFTYSVSDGTSTDTGTVNLTVTDPSALPGDIFSDDFSGASLDTDWTLQGPTGTAGVVVAGPEAYLELTVGAGNNQPWQSNTSTRVMQTATNEDFGLEAKFLSTPTQKYQLQGFLVEQDANNWLRFDTYSSGSKQFVFAAVTLGGSSTPQFNVEVAAGAASYLRVDRTGDLWTLDYSSDGQTWITAGSFTQALTVDSVGVFAGNTGGAPGFTAQVDYFFNSAAPISPEDGAIGQTPVAGDDTAAADLDTPLVINVASDLLANDSDPNGDPLSLAGFTQPANGTLVDNGDGTLTYTPNTGYLGADSFGYTVTDGTNTDTATVDVTVTNPADPPVAVDDAASADLDTPLVINVASDLLANDTDPNGDPLSLAGFTQPANGTVVDNGDGTLTYTPNTGYLGADSFTYSVSDGTSTDTGTVNLTVTDPSALPGDIFSDDFSGASLDTDWTLQGPTGTAGVVVAGPEAYLELTVGAGNNQPWQSNTSTRVMQTATNEDFGLEAKFLSTPTQKYQLQGFLVEQDANNWLRFDTYSSGSKQFVFAAVTLGGSSTPQFNVEVAAGAASYLRVDRTGDLWTLDYSSDGQTWITAGSFTQALTVDSVGVFAGNTGGAPGFTAQVDYFFNSAAPISPEDGAIGQTPVAGDDTAAADLDTPLVINVASDLLANDSDPNGDPLSLAGFTQPANGTLVDNGDGTLTYTPNTGYLGADSFGYTVTDGTNTDTATVDVTVNNPFAPPVAVDDAASADLDTPLVINVASDLLANDTDPNGDPLSLAGFTQPANGTVVDNGDGTLTYTPNTGYLGADSFTYSVSDGTSTDTGTVNLTVTDPSALPGDIFSDDFSGASLDTDWTLQGPAGTANVAQAGIEAYLEIALPSGGNYDAWNTNMAARVLQAATNENFGLEAKFLSTPSERYQMQGILVEQDAGNWLRFDTVHNGSSLRLFAAITLGGVSVKIFDFAIAPGAASHLRVDRIGDDWTFSHSDDGQTWSTAGSLNQALTVNSVGPFAGSTGGAPGFTAQVDYFFNSAAPISPEDPLPASPEPVDDIVSGALDTPLVINVASDLLANDTDPNGDPLSLSSFGQPVNGTVVDNGDGTLTYTPNASFSGVDRFSYSVGDGTGTPDASADVFVGVANDAPSAQNDVAATNEDTTTVIDVLANDIDLNSDPFSIISVGSAANGTVVLDDAGTPGDGSDDTIIYTPDANYFGSDTFDYVISDGVASSTGTVNVTVNSVEDPPVAQNDFVSTLPDTGLTINVAGDLLANDSDGDGDPLSLSGFTQPTNGTLVDNGNGTLSYTPNAGYFGSDSFTYTITDGTGFADANVDINVQAPITVWYGDTQTFGALGESQQWINILGNVDLDQVTQLSYSLNGGADRFLAVGPDTRRLHESGDFNIDIDYAELDGTAVDDTVTIKATLTDGSVATSDVTIDFEAGNQWASNYSIDWSTVTNIQDVAQVADGQWTIDASGVRPTSQGYDRLFTLGDSSWDSYEVNLTVTMHDLTTVDPAGRDGGAFAFGMLWNGHTDEPISGFQPKSGWEQSSAFFFDSTGLNRLYNYDTFAEIESQPYSFDIGSTYNFTIRIEQTNVFDYTYSLKYWEEGASEPIPWNIQETEQFAAPATGSFGLNAHYFDVTFGDITVTEIVGSDIVVGDENAETFSAVDLTQALPGLNETDVFTGGLGADTFVFGDASAVFYDDGNAATDGTGDYGLIWDFESGVDQVQLAGIAQDYLLAASSGGLQSGTALYHVNAGGPDELVAVFNGVSGLSLDTVDFVYVELDPPIA